MLPNTKEAAHATDALFPKAELLFLSYVLLRMYQEDLTCRRLEIKQCTQLHIQMGFQYIC